MWVKQGGLCPGSGGPGCAALPLLRLGAVRTGVLHRVGRLEPLVVAIEGDPPDSFDALAAEVAADVRRGFPIVGGLGHGRILAVSADPQPEVGRRILSRDPPQGRQDLAPLELQLLAPGAGVDGHLEILIA